MQSLICLQLAPSPPPLIGGGSRTEPTNCFSGGTFIPVRSSPSTADRSSVVCFAAKGKNVRETVTIECTSCRTNAEKRSNGVSRYTTQKNKRNTPGKLELKKYCPYCNKHAVHVEIKK